MSLVGSRIGSIRITALLGEGGMGEVYAGFDEKLRREVALKALRGDALDPRTRARLLREARVLSRLSHPHICTIYELLEHGEGDFLVLERIRGQSLREALKRGIDPSRKLRLAEQTAEAIAAAHAQGIVHRDLKPANVMLTEDWNVKVLDFGLARSSGEPGEAAEGVGEAPDRGPEEEWTASLQTSLGSVAGTAACMSPEQARGEAVTAASDVYSLGLLLQELFTGSPPYEKGLPHHVLLVKARDADTLPTTGIDRDLAALIQRMKSPAPAERPTAPEVLRRLAWVRDKPKRRLRAAAAVLAVLLAAAGAVKHTYDLRRERDRAVAAHTEAERARAEAEEVARFLEEVFETSDPRSGRGGGLPARELLDQGAARVRAELRNQPLVRARLMGTIGRIYLRLGLFREAEPLLKEALSLRERTLGPESAEVAESLHDLGTCRLEQRRREAEPLLRRALAIRERVLGPGHPEVAETLAGLGTFLAASGRLEEAEKLLRRAVAIREAGPAGPGTASALYSLGTIRARQGDTADAERLLRRALAMREELFPPDHPDVGTSIVSLGVLLGHAGRPAEAIPLYRRALASLEKSLGPEHPTVASAYSNLALCLMDTGREAEAEAALRRSLEIREKVFGPGHAGILPSLRGFALLYRRQGRWAEVDAVTARGLLIAERELPPGNVYATELPKLRQRP